jgi:hypothetical protein
VKHYRFLNSSQRFGGACYSHLKGLCCLIRRGVTALTLGMYIIVSTNCSSVGRHIPNLALKKIYKQFKQFLSYVHTENITSRRDGCKTCFLQVQAPIHSAAGHHLTSQSRGRNRDLNTKQILDNQ